MITINQHSKIPLYEQIYNEIKNEIRSGIYKSGDRLPSKRHLAAELSVSVNTVEGAYLQLVSEGYIEAKPQSGFFVLEMTDLIHNSYRTDYTYTEEKVNKPEIDFSPSDVDREGFPFETWKRVYKQCFDVYDERFLKSSPHQGLLTLRNALCDYLYRSRGVNCTSEQIVIGSGSESLLQIAGKLFSGDIGIENPVYNKAYQIFSGSDRRVIPFLIDEKGINADKLENADINAVYITPSHQFPLGMSMPIGRRLKLLSWVNETENRYIIEDDYDSEFRYYSKPIPSLQGLDSNEKVIYLGTFSKAIAPSVRISYMVLPKRLLESYQRQYASFGSGVSRLEQRVIERFISGGYFEKHLNKMRKIYRQKRETLINELSDLDGEIIGENAGHHILFKLNGSLSETEMIEKANAFSVRVYPVSSYFIGAVPDFFKSCVLLGYGALTEREIKKGILILKKAWK